MADVRPIFAEPPGSDDPEVPQPLHDGAPGRRFDLSDRLFVGSLTTVFIALGIFNVLHHPMWRDETRAWQIAASSPTIAALHENLRYEGVPLLWYLIVWTVTRCTQQMLVMQIVHVLIAAGVVGVFAWNAPFPRWIKTAFAFGYFPFFEYATISRNYSLLFLLFLIGVAIVARPKPAPLTFGMVMVLLTQVSIWGAGFAALLTLVAVLRWYGADPRPPLWHFLSAGSIVLLACALCYLQARPGPGNSFIATWRDATLGDRFMGTVGTIWDGWLPLPWWTPTFWNTNLLDDHLVIRFVFSCLLLVTAILCVLRRPLALLLLVGGLGGLMTFTFTQFVGATRHNGHLFMILIGACWIARQSREWSPPGQWLSRVTARLQHVLPLLLGILLAIHVISGVGANLAGVYVPFTAGRDVADYIRRELPADASLVGIDDYCLSPVAAYLGRDFYFPQMHKVAPFNTQNDKARYPVSLESIFADFRMLNMTEHHDIVFVLSSGRTIGNNEFDAQLGATALDPAMVFHVKLLKQFNRSTVADESEAVYLVHRSD